jgi:sugar phosphate isomerase/epimerase
MGLQGVEIEAIARVEDNLLAGQVHQQASFKDIAYFLSSVAIEVERLVIILERMREYGIDGIECYHPSSDDVQSEALRKYALKHGLIITKGSDFHSDYLNRDFSRYHRP